MTVGSATGPGLWTDRDGRVVHVPEPPSTGSYYRPIGDFQADGYDRNAFALGTEQEIAFLSEVLELVPGTRLLDVGCATGRHIRTLAELGVDSVGVDISGGLLRAGRDRFDRDRARGTAHFVQADARSLPLPSCWGDVVLCLCQGGFGITPGGDARILTELARVLRPGGTLVLTAFSLAFAIRYLAPDDAVDVSRGLVHSPAEVRGPDGERRTYDLWTACYTPGQLAALCSANDLRVEALTGVEPGAYGRDAPTIRHPELLVRATRR